MALLAIFYYFFPLPLNTFCAVIYDPRIPSTSTQGTVGSLSFRYCRRCSFLSSLLLNLVFPLDRLLRFTPELFQTGYSTCFLYFFFISVPRVQSVVGCLSGLPRVLPPPKHLASFLSTPHFLFSLPFSKCCSPLWFRFDSLFYRIDVALLPGFSFTVPPPPESSPLFRGFYPVGTRDGGPSST